MTPEQMQQLVSVNQEVNVLPYDAVPGLHEPFNWWTDKVVPGNSFVCRDYVLVKIEKLEALGWAKPLLTVIECYVEPAADPVKDNRYHAVLGVQDGADTWIMDSRIDQPYTLASPISPADQYQWDRRQIPGTLQFEDMA